jgi:hypothetical protein
MFGVRIAREGVAYGAAQIAVELRGMTLTAAEHDPKGGQQ